MAHIKNNFYTILFFKVKIVYTWEFPGTNGQDSVLPL